METARLRPRTLSPTAGRVGRHLSRKPLHGGAETKKSGKLTDISASSSLLRVEPAGWIAENSGCHYQGNRMTTRLNGILDSETACELHKVRAVSRSSS